MAALSRGCKPRIPTWYKRDINGGYGAVINHAPTEIDSLSEVLE